MQQDTWNDFATYKARPARILCSDLADIVTVGDDGKRRIQRGLRYGSGFWTNGQVLVKGPAPRLPQGSNILDFSIPENIARLVASADPQIELTPEAWRDGVGGAVWARSEAPRRVRLVSVEPVKPPPVVVNAHYFDIIRRAHPSVKFFSQGNEVATGAKPIVGMVEGWVAALVVPLRSTD